MIFDSKGKLFGKINIVDILIVVIILAAVGGVGYKLAISKGAFSKASDIEIKFYGEEVPNFAANTMKVGDTAKDSEKNSIFGKVKDIKMDKSVSWGQASNGQIVASTKEGYSSVNITIDGKGLFNATGVTIGNADYYVGQTINLRIGTAAFYIRISDIAKKG